MLRKVACHPCAGAMLISSGHPSFSICAEVRACLLSLSSRTLSAAGGSACCPAQLRAGCSAGHCCWFAGRRLPSVREGPADFTGLSGPSRRLCHLSHSTSLYWCSKSLPVYNGSLRSETGRRTAPENHRPRSCSLSPTLSHGGPPPPCIGGFLLGHFCPFKGALILDCVPFGQIRGL